MFNLGGTVILPQPLGDTDSNGLPDIRLIALWPYTRIGDPRLIIRDDFILIRASPGLAAHENWLLQHSWLAGLLVGGLLFRISLTCSRIATYPDRGLQYGILL